jgi:hypothetical protein
MEVFRNTYGFKDTPRAARDVMNFGRKDKVKNYQIRRTPLLTSIETIILSFQDIEVSPDAYEVEKYQTLTTDKCPSKQVF